MGKFTVVMGLSLICVTSFCACTPESPPSSMPVVPRPTTGPVAAAVLPSVPEGAQTLSLFGTPLSPPQLAEDTRAEREKNLEDAELAYRNEPTNIENIIWLGRRKAYLGEYRDAVAVFTRGIEAFPRSAKLYRHRGHRYITLRIFDAAIRDLEQAVREIQAQPDEIEPDGLPNAMNIPLGTLHFNVWYHLGLVQYLEGEYANALECYLQCLDVSRNPDLLVATTHWTYMTLRRLGRDAAAAELLKPITAEMKIIENHGYHQLILLYRGLRPAEELLSSSADDIQNATVGYGVANWHHAEGRKDQAVEGMKQIIQGKQWAAFGYIAAESDLKRWGVDPQ